MGWVDDIEFSFTFGWIGLYFVRIWMDWAGSFVGLDNFLR